MEQRRKRKILQVDGMSCTNCEIRIENALKKLKGIIEANAFFNSSNDYITYDANVINLEQIIRAIEEMDYIVRNKPGMATVSKTDTKQSADDKLSVGQFLAIGVILLALYLIIRNTVGFSFIPEINPQMGYGILFIVGLLTSIHCDYLMGLCHAGLSSPCRSTL